MEYSGLIQKTILERLEMSINDISDDITDLTSSK